MDKKKLPKKIAIVAGVLILLVLLVNIGLNLWLNNFLPGYIKNNSFYKVSYSNLSVDIATGNINADQLTIATKNPADQNIIGLDGTAEKVSISRLGIYDALMNKKINSSDLNLIKPNLKITLAKPVDDRTGKKRNPMGFKNITVSDGNIAIYRHTRQKFVSINNLDLQVSNLKMTEEAVENKLPVVFDEYSIKGTDFFYRPDNIYLLKAKNITTKNGQMSIQKFQLIPLVTYRQFVHYLPNRSHLFQADIHEMKFSDILLKNNRIELSQVKMDSPDVKIYTTNAKKAKSKPFTYEVDLQDVQMNKAKIQMYKPDGNTLFAANTLNVDIDQLLMDGETAKGNIPFSYEKFLIKGTGIQYNSVNQNISVDKAHIDKNLVLLQNVLAKPAVAQAAGTLADVSANLVQLKLNDWKFENNKLKLDAESALVTGLNGNLYTHRQKEPKKNGFSFLQFPLKVKTVQISSPSFSIHQDGNTQSLQNLNVRVQNLEMNEETVKSGVPFKSGNYSVTVANFRRKINQFYTVSAGLLKVNNGNLQINNFALNPLVSRAQFIRMIPHEKDLYDLKAAQIQMNGSWDLISQNKFLKAQNLTVNGLQANIFRSKIPRDDQTVKPMYSELLRSVKFPMVINNVDIKNSVLLYEEDTKQSEGPGKLTFGNFNLNLKNLNSGKKAGGSTHIAIRIQCRFMNASPMNVRWNLDTASMNDSFTISGNIADLPASRINPFIEPYLKIRATGVISDLIFDFKGSISGLKGTLKMKHQALKIDLLKDTGEKKKVLSAVVNMVVKSNSGDFPESVPVEDVKRDPTKSFFNLFWNGIQQGLKKTLIGKNVETTEKSVKNTIKDVKTTTEKVKNEVKKTAETVKGEPAADGEKKPGFIKRIFNKKEKTE